MKPHVEDTHNPGPEPHNRLQKIHSYVMLFFWKISLEPFSILGLPRLPRFAPVPGRFAARRKRKRRRRRGKNFNNEVR